MRIRRKLRADVDELLFICFDAKARFLTILTKKRLVKILLKLLDAAVLPAIKVVFSAHGKKLRPDTKVARTLLDALFGVGGDLV